MAEPEIEFPPDYKSPATFAEALAGMVDRPFLASQRWQDQQHRAVRDGAHPDILLFERTFIRALSKLGVPAFTSECLRSGERQEDLFALGHSRARAGKSAHQFGCAIDVVHSVRGWSLREKEWAIMGHVGKEVAKARGLNIVWGGDWSFYDPAHWQVLGWENQIDSFPWYTP